MLQRAKALLRHIALSRRDSGFEPYTAKIVAAGYEFQFFVATATGEDWYVAGMPRDDAGRVLHESTENELTINELLRPGDVVLEVGAHHGFMSTLLARHVGESGHVTVFEPMMENVEIIQQNIDQNQLSNVTLEAVAVGDQDGTVTLIERTNSFVEPKSRFSIRKIINEAIYPTASVPSLTLDSYCEKHSIRPNVLKIDVEGFEVEVLRGAKNILATRPRILLEVHPRQIESFGNTLAELHEIVQQPNQHYLLLDGKGNVREQSELLPQQLRERIHIYMIPNESRPGSVRDAGPAAVSA